MKTYVLKLKVISYWKTKVYQQERKKNGNNDTRIGKKQASETYLG